MNVYVAGLVFQLSLIVALGPQNALLLRYGLRRQTVTLVVIVCAVCDILLIILAGLGVGIIIEKAPIVLDILRYAGFLYLLWFAFTCFRDAWHPKAFGEEDSLRCTSPEDTDSPLGLAPTGATVGTADAAKPHRVQILPQHLATPTIAAITVSLVNPNAYVDLFVILGSLAESYGPDKWVFLLGAITASIFWFPSIGYGAAALSRPLSNPQVWRWINAGIGVFMVFMAFRILFM